MIKALRYALVLMSSMSLMRARRKTHREYSVSLLKSPLLSALGLGLGFQLGLGLVDDLPCPL